MWRMIRILENDPKKNAERVTPNNIFYQHNIHL